MFKKTPEWFLMFFIGCKGSTIIEKFSISRLFLMDFGIFKLGNFEIAENSAITEILKSPSRVLGTKIPKFAQQPNLLNLVSN
jgi:hypothetical protein